MTREKLAAMIDPKQPPPGWVPSYRGGEWSYRPDMHAKTTDARRIYAAESQSAVVNFAERVCEYLHSIGVVADDVILAAARGERTLP